MKVIAIVYNFDNSLVILKISQGDNTILSVGVILRKW